ncbi:MAG TPA: hypothetical protein VL994_05635 [Steroidobacteraceae bacterium]|nr:hypothetical protein [Steroidobacteraceae bacterium]
MRSSFRGVLAALLLALVPLAAQAGVVIGVSVNIAPPVLPVYVQPPLPAPGYMWTPGYWAWAPSGYYWVPGTWVMPPQPGLLWTPGYWGWVNGAYLWHGGYWGPHVGFYGGVNYGYGYGGAGFAGGEWRGGQFFYNSAVSNVHNVTVVNVYNRTVVAGPVNRVAFNGGPGGVVAHASPAELAAAHEHHVAFTPSQREHENMARGNESLRASVNGGHPPIAATARPAAFTGHGVVAAHNAAPPPGGARYHSPTPGSSHPPGAAQPGYHAPQGAAMTAHNPPGASPGGAQYHAPPSQGGHPGGPQGGYHEPQGGHGGEPHNGHDGRR